MHNIAHPASYDRRDQRDQRDGIEESMQRDDVIETLTALAAPLGPFTSIDAWLKSQARWIDEGGLPLFNALMDLLVAPPREEQLRGTSIDEWRDMLVEI